MADIISQIKLPDNKVYDIKDNSKVAKTGDTMTGNLTAPKFIGALDEANLTWGGKNFSASYGCIDAALMDELGANRFQFIKADAITVEYTRDGGTTWTDYGATNTQKQQIFAQGGGLIIGKADSTHKATEHPGLYQLRITIDTGVAGVYTYLNKFIIYVGTNGSANCICKIQKALQSTPTTFIDHTDWIPIGGWSGYNVLNVNSFATYGNSPSSQYGRVRFIFKDGTGGNTNYIGLSVSQIKAFGGVGWSTPSTMAKTGHIYSYDQNQNVTFPGNVTAPKFIGALQGNANTASNAQTVNGHTVNSDVPSNAVFTDTTYTFANGTNGFTVTPSGGTAQTVTVTPSITNNVTGSGTSGYLAKFNGANTITNGAQLGSDTTKFLRNDGEWAVPPGAGNIIYGVCNTASNVSEKTVTCSNFTSLVQGVTIHVYFTYCNKAIEPTLNVNNTGAKPLCKGSAKDDGAGGSVLAGNTPDSSWWDCAMVSLTYDGANWHLNDVYPYSNRNEAQNGKELSLVTNGEKYIWNHKSDLQIGTSSTTALKGDTKYAGASTAGGAATSAEKASKLSNTTKVGDTNQPVYFTANGVPSAISYTIESNVPSDAVFTDTDEKVTQTATSTNANYEVLFSESADNTTKTEGARKNNNLKFNPSTGNLQVTKLNDSTIGSNPVFTDNKVTQTNMGNSSSYNDYYRILLGKTPNTTTETNGSYKANYLKYNPYTNSVALGYECSVSGTNSFSQGYFCSATGDNQHVFGKYNIADNTSLEIIGNGSNNSSRSNARTLDSSGNEWLAGGISINNVSDNSAAILNAKTDTWTISTNATNNLDTTKYSGTMYFKGSDDTNTGLITNFGEATGAVTTQIGAYNKKTNGDNVSNLFKVVANKDGSATYEVSSPANFRSAIGAAQATSWYEVDHKGGTTAIPIPSGTTEICCVITVGNNTIAWTFTLPYAALSSTSWRYTNAYTSVSDGYIAVNVSTTQVSLNAVYNGKSNVTSSSILYLYAR